jgi:hypothetical protein
MCCARSCFHQMDSFHHYSKQTLYFYSPLKILDTEDQNFSTEFHPQGIESTHHFPYASQNASARVLHPYGWRTHVSNDRSLEGTTSPRPKFFSSSFPLYQDLFRHQYLELTTVLFLFLVFFFVVSAYT